LPLIGKVNLGGNLGINLGGDLGINLGGDLGINLGGKVEYHLGGDTDRSKLPNYSEEIGSPGKCRYQGIKLFIIPIGFDTFRSIDRMFQRIMSVCMVIAFIEPFI